MTPPTVLACALHCMDCARTQCETILLSVSVDVSSSLLAHSSELRIRLVPSSSRLFSADRDNQSDSEIQIGAFPTECERIHRKNLSSPAALHGY